MSEPFLSCYLFPKQFIVSAKTHPCIRMDSLHLITPISLLALSGFPSLLGYWPTEAIIPRFCGAISIRRCVKQPRRKGGRKRRYALMAEQKKVPFLYAWLFQTGKSQKHE